MAFKTETGAGLSDATSYTTTAFASEYLKFETQFALWSSASTGAKELALEYATRTIDEFFQFWGIQAQDGQSLQWPRMYAYIEGRDDYLPFDAVPVVVQRATALIALDFIANGNKALTLPDVDTTTSMSIPDLSIQKLPNASTSMFSNRVLTALSQVGRDLTGGNGSFRIVRN